MDRIDKHKFIYTCTDRLLKGELNEWEYMMAMANIGVPSKAHLTITVSTILPNNHHKYN